MQLHFLPNGTIMILSKTRSEAGRARRSCTGKRRARPHGRDGMKLPSDGAMLLSFVNTKLRDVYDSLDALCEDCEADRGELEEKLRALGYEYDPARNAFR